MVAWLLVVKDCLKAVWPYTRNDHTSYRILLIIVEKVVFMILMGIKVRGHFGAYAAVMKRLHQEFDKLGVELDLEKTKVVDL